MVDGLILDRGGEVSVQVERAPVEIELHTKQSFLDGLERKREWTGGDDPQR
jgi:hypothetical protein